MSRSRPVVAIVFVVVVIVTVVIVSLLSRGGNESKLAAGIKVDTTSANCGTLDDFTVTTNTDPTTIKIVPVDEGDTLANNQPLFIQGNVDGIAAGCKLRAFVRNNTASQWQQLFEAPVKSDGEFRTYRGTMSQDKVMMGDVAMVLTLGDKNCEEAMRPYLYTQQYPVIPAACSPVAVLPITVQPAT